MSNWLQSYTKSCCNELDAIAKLLQSMEDAFIKSNDKYYQHAQVASDPNNYQGQGATAFIAAVNTDINKSKYRIEGLGHVSSATATLQTAITNSSQHYDRKLEAIANDFPLNPYLAEILPYGVPQATFDEWRDQLITKTLNGVGTQQQLLDEILRNGDKCILTAWGPAFKSVESTVQQDASNTPASGGLLGGIIDTIKDGFTLAQQALNHPFVSAFHDLANAVKPLLQDWANEIEREYPTFQNTLKNFEYLSARDLFYYIGNNVDGTQNTDKPITITPYTTQDGKKGLLVTIGGTDITHFWDDSLITALQTGTGIQNNPYMTAVEDAIQKYMDEHPEMQGADITFAGYSLGGMIAQDWAKELSSNDQTDLTRYHLHVRNVITYGSPVMGSPAPGVHYAMYDATYDPIPLLSSYENPQLTGQATQLVDKLVNNPLSLSPSDLWNNKDALYKAYLSLIHTDQEPWQQKLNTYIDPLHQYQGQIFNINDVGNVSTGTGDPHWDPQLTNPFNVNMGHTLNFSNHQQYQSSNQLNAATTTAALPNIDPQSLGPTEYFGSYAPVH